MIETAPRYLSPFFSVYAENKDKSISPAGLTRVVNGYLSSPDLPKDEKGYPVRPGIGKYIPTLNRDDVPETGVLFEAGSIVLETPADESLLLQTIQYWPVYQQSEYAKSVSIIGDLGSPTISNVVATESIQLTLDVIKKIDPNQRPAFTMDYAYRLLQENYEKTCNKYGIKPENRTDLLDTNANEKTPGYSTLQQEIDFQNTSRMLPTYSWANRGYEGPAYISLNDETLSYLRQLQLKRTRIRRSELEKKSIK
jgi:hypothetical protein